MVSDGPKTGEYDVNRDTGNHLRMTYTVRGTPLEISEKDYLNLFRAAMPTSEDLVQLWQEQVQVDKKPHTPAQLAVTGFELPWESGRNQKIFISAKMTGEDRQYADQFLASRGVYQKEVSQNGKQHDLIDLGTIFEKLTKIDYRNPHFC
eukprot:COSAG01_NODE_3015_length_6719_cov_129.305996_4_plen_149_part_00